MVKFQVTDRDDETGVLARTIHTMQTDLRALYQKLADQIEELSLMQKRLRISEEYYRAIFENSAIPLILIDKDMTISLANHKFEELWGYSRDEVEGKMRWTSFVSTPEDRERMLSYSQHRSDHPESVPWTYEFQMKTRSENVKSVIVSISQMPGKKQYLTSLLDITDIKRVQEEITRKSEELSASYEELAAIEEELRHQYTELQKKDLLLKESENRYKNVVEDQTEFICRTRADGTIVFVNEALCRYFGVTSEEILGTKKQLPFADHDEYKLDLYGVSYTHDQPMHTHEFRVILKNGEIRWNKWSIRAIFNKEGILTEFQSVGRDIHERKKVEEENARALEQIEKNLAELSILNDGIRNPLTIIESLTEDQPVDTGLIIKQIRAIDDLIKTLDQRWMDSDKILTYLRKHHGYLGKKR